MQQARPTNAVECKAEVGLRAIAVRMGVLSNGTLHLTTVYWRPRCIRQEFVRNSTSARRGATNYFNNTINCWRILRRKWSKLTRAFIDCSRETNDYTNRAASYSDNNKDMQTTSQYADKR
ncbi:Uncharacterized protein DBV15_04837 [Temnothorax longispinosus]|uniref:Uncharacterized protein n=1 Tax=Temnothorax longispinosus TaxID=300112 RepID=A0A4S2KGS2_9HYME|nr:Uncharacterized protein DBV15_04837 [Temnothorax longispinosus]